MKARPKKFWEMNARELAAATREFDQPIPASRMRPLNRDERVRFARAKRSPARTLLLVASETGVWVPLDAKTRKQTAKYAAEHHLSVAELFERGVKHLLSGR